MTSSIQTTLSAIAVTALLATPGLAKSQHHQARISHTPVATNSTFVTVESHVVGVDPDPNVKCGILRDYPFANAD
jgi:hypothetical protein